jgi:hypothetical protein
MTSVAPTWSQVVARGHAGPVTPTFPANASRSVTHYRDDSGGSHSSSGLGAARRPASVSSTCVICFQII